ncbi:PQQ-binding-like beta-propeller repeat protein [Chenggangzhangella methanolivorans]
MTFREALMRAFVVGALAGAPICGEASAADPLPGDWAQPKFDAAGAAYNPFETAISTDTAKKLVRGWSSNAQTRVSAGPVTANGLVYFTSGSLLSALDVESGRKVWVHDFDNARVQTTPAVSGGRLYVGDGEQAFYAFDAATGKQKWRASLSCSAYSVSPIVAGGAVYFGCDDNRLYSLTAKTGARRWSTDMKGPLVAAAATDGKNVFATNNYGVLTALAAKTGQVKWTTKLQILSVATPAVVDGTVYVTDAGAVWAFSAKNGKRRWKSAPLGATGGSPAVGEGVVAVTDSNGVYAFDARTGKTRWTFQTATNLNATPAIANGLVFVGLTEGNVAALRLTDGREMWRSKPGVPAFTTSPAIARGSLFFGTSEWSAGEGQVFRYLLKE